MVDKLTIKPPAMIWATSQKCFRLRYVISAKCMEAPVDMLIGGDVTKAQWLLVRAWRNRKTIYHSNNIWLGPPETVRA